jgi:hypothetical protein
MFAVSSAGWPRRTFGRRPKVDLTDVHAGAESASCSGEHPHPQVWVCVELVIGVSKIHRKLIVEGIQGIRPVQSNTADMAVPLKENGFVVR